MLLSLNHVTVCSADLDASERFYCGLLGMRLGPRPAIAQPGRWFYVGDTAVLHVLSRAAGGVDGNTGTGGTIDHFALSAEDRPAFERRLTAAGQPFRSLRLADSDTWQIFLTDPDGAQVELSFGAPTPVARARGRFTNRLAG